MKIRGVRDKWPNYGSTESRGKGNTMIGRHENRREGVGMRDLEKWKEGFGESG